MNFLYEEKVDFKMCIFNKNIKLSLKKKYWFAALSWIYNHKKESNPMWLSLFHFYNKID